MSENLDAIDLRLLKELQNDGRLTTAELAQRVNLSQSPCWRRVNRLEINGAIRGYHAELDRKALGFDLVVFVTIGLAYQEAELIEKFQDAATSIPEIVMMHSISGEDDYLLVVVSKDMSSFSTLLHETLHNLPGVKRLHSNYSLREIKGVISNAPVNIVRTPS